METIKIVVESIWDMLNEMSPYLLLGFLIAGLMHAFVPGRMFHKYLSAKNFRSVLNAALLGIPLPLCSCGVIPTAMSLRKEGASKGAAVSFLVATPQTGVDSILASYSLLGLPFAIIRPIAALVTSLFAGQMVSITEKDADEEEKTIRKADVSKEEEHESFGHKLKEALGYAYVEMMEDIGKWLVIGIVIAGVISLIPSEYFALFKDNSIASILLVLVLAIPMYLCATGSIPIAVALMLKGLTPGAALVMLMAGPASNMASIMVIGKVLGRRTLVTYLSSIIFGSIVFALIIDYLLPASWFILPMMSGGECCHEDPSIFAIICSVLLICLLVNALCFHHHDHDHCHCHDGESCECHCEDHQLKVTGMRCNHCAANVKKAVESVEGTSEVSVDLQSGMVNFEGEVDVAEVRKSIEALGYTCSDEVTD